MRTTSQTKPNSQTQTLPRSEAALAVEEAWEAYAQGDWESAACFADHTDARARAIGVLALLEQNDRGGPGRTVRELRDLDETAEGFRDLLIGMRAFHSQDRDLCTRHLGRWLLGHDFFATWILERFTTAAHATENHALLFGVSAKFLKRRSAAATVAGPAVAAAHALGRHREAVQLFRTYRELTDDPLVVQKAAFSMLHTGEHAEALDLLDGLYRRVTGRPYRRSPEEFEVRREEAAARVQELRGRTPLSAEDERELGMSLLFLGRHNEALRVLEHSLARATRRATKTGR